jgi:hypothetical protein
MLDLTKLPQGFSFNARRANGNGPWQFVIEDGSNFRACFYGNLGESDETVFNRALPVVNAYDLSMTQSIAASSSQGTSIAKTTAKTSP